MGSCTRVAPRASADWFASSRPGPDGELTRGAFRELIPTGVAHPVGFLMVGLDVGIGRTALRARGSGHGRARNLPPRTLRTVGSEPAAIAIPIALRFIRSIARTFRPQRACVRLELELNAGGGSFSCSAATSASSSAITSGSRNVVRSPSARPSAISLSRRRMIFLRGSWAGRRPRGSVWAGRVCGYGRQRVRGSDARSRPCPQARRAG